MAARHSNHCGGVSYRACKAHSGRVDAPVGILVGGEVALTSRGRRGKFLSLTLQNGTRLSLNRRRLLHSSYRAVISVQFGGSVLRIRTAADTHYRANLHLNATLTLYAAYTSRPLLQIYPFRRTHFPVTLEGYVLVFPANPGLECTTPEGPCNHIRCLSQQEKRVEGDCR
jgi:hypothetical protein